MIRIPEYAERRRSVAGAEAEPAAELEPAVR
jgi:hypothetical protein